jgi:hypothetical protein
VTEEDTRDRDRWRRETTVEWKSPSMKMMMVMVMMMMRRKYGFICLLCVMDVHFDSHIVFWISVVVFRVEVFS